MSDRNADQAAERLRGWVERDVSSMPLDVDITTVLADRDRLASRLAAVRALADPADPDNPDAYWHYAVRIGEEVHLGVLVEDLRAALDAGEGETK